MRRFPILGLILASALLLSGCASQVVSKTPWFTNEDAQDAPAVRSGWWGFKDKDCRYRIDDPNAHWPDCVRSSAILLPSGDRLILRRGTVGAANLLLVKGNPPILQLDYASDPSDGTLQTYAGFKALANDHEGRVTAFKVWPVVCGPEGPPTDEKPYTATTRKPWLELTMNAEGDCTATNLAALRNAARRSPKNGDTMQLHWLRDWRPGDQTWEEWLATQDVEPP